MSGASPPIPRYVEAAVRSELDALAATAHGRNDQLNRSSFAIGTLVAAGAYGRDDAETALFAAAETNGHAKKHGPARTRATIKSGIEAGLREPRTIPNGNGHSLNGNKPYVNGTSRPKVDTPPRPAPKLSGVPVPLWTIPDAETGKPRFADIGADEPRQVSGELRRHRYTRDGKIVRVKLKRGQSDYLDFYRVVRPEDGAVGWQAKRPAGYVPVPYNVAAFDRELADDAIFGTEGEKDTDSLVRLGQPAFTFGSSSTCRTGSGHSCRVET